MIKVLLLNLENGKTFDKNFKCEFDKDKFIRKLRYSKKLKLVKDYTQGLNN